MISGKPGADLRLAILIVAAGSVFTAAGFFFELFHPTAHMSDVTLHLSVLQALDQNMRAGGSAFDFWYDLSPFGYPLFRTYQHLPHLIIYSLHRLSGSAVPLESLLRFSIFAFAAALPWAFFWSARLFGLPWLSAGFAALCACLLAEAGDYGLGMHNYVWGSGGIITQLWAAVFLAPALGLTRLFLQSGRHLGFSLLIAFVCCGCHMVSAFILGVSVLLFTLLEFCAKLASAGSFGVSFKVLWRTAVYFAALAFCTAYQWVFIIFDRRYMHTSPHEPHWKYASYGFEWVLRNFWNGDLFDAGRFPVVSIFVLIGFVAAVAGLGVKDAAGRASRPEREVGYSSLLALGLGLMLWLSLLCGHDVWGWLFASAPVLEGLHMHRLVAGVHVFGVLLAGWGAFWLVHWLRWRALGLAAAGLLLWPAFSERWGAYQRAHFWLDEALQAQENDQDLSRLIGALKNRRRGWVHVGMEHNWAKELSVGKNLRLRHVTIGEGIPTMGQLYHAYGLSGDVLFDFNPYREGHYEWLAAAYTVAPAGWQAPHFLEEIRRYGRYQLYVYPRAGMLDVVRVGFEVGKNFEPQQMSQFMRTWFKSPLVENKIAGRISRTPKDGELPFFSFSENVPAWLAAPGAAGRVLEESGWQAQRVSGKVRMLEPAYVLLKTNFHPNWKAFIDGTPAQTEWVTPGFVAVACPRGEHTVVFVYQASRVKPWLFLASLVGLGLMILSRGRVHA